MKSKKLNWTKSELHVYILLLCANADKKQTQEELELILSKVSKKTFKKMYAKFHKHSENKRFKKVEKAVKNLEYSERELAEFKREMRDIFLADNSFSLFEKRLEWTLDNILY